MTAASNPKPEGGRRRICVVTPAIRRDADKDDASAPGELARLFAEDGDDVTLLWVAGRDVPSTDEVAARRAEFGA
ncbi:MAG: hypothetical protein E5X98_09245, partial [Mesorhizobium sp.]